MLANQKTMQSFNISRFRNTLLWHLTSDRKTLLNNCAGGGLLAAALPCLFWLAFGVGGGHIATLAGGLSAIAIAYFTTCGAFVVSNIPGKQRRISALLLPASKLESFLSRYLCVLVARPAAVLAGLLAGDLLQLAVFALLQRETSSLTMTLLQTLGDMAAEGAFTETAALAMLAHAIFLLSGTIIRRHAWIKTNLLLLAVVTIVPLIIIGVSKLVFDTIYGARNYNIIFDENSPLWAAGFYTVTLAIVALCYWGAYRVYARMQAVSNRWHNL